jgi:hypothetical protein
MTDDSTPRFILPDSVVKRPLGLIEGAMPNPRPRQWAEHLELLTTDGKFSSVGDMLELMHSELDRLQEQIDANEEPDRHSETVLAAATAEILDERAGQYQRENRRETYFAILLGYLYGRLTKPGKQSEREALGNYFVAKKLSQAEARRQAGPRSVEDEREAGRQWMREKAAAIWEKDHAQELLIGVVAAKVSNLVENEAKEREAMRDESVRKWPKSLEKIRKAIRPVAPAYATKGGRPSRK